MRVRRVTFRAHLRNSFVAERLVLVDWLERRGAVVRVVKSEGPRLYVEWPTSGARRLGAIKGARA